MPSTAFDATDAASAPTVIATDGSKVRVLCATDHGSMAQFTLAPGIVSRAVAHRTIDELWYVVQGRGRIWRRCGAHEEVSELRPGVSLSIPVGTRFQFRNDGVEPLVAVGVAMPPWPGDGEAYPVAGAWPATA